MEQVLNYISKKIEALKCNIDIINNRSQQNSSLSDELLDNKRELKILNNIYSTIEGGGIKKLELTVKESEDVCGVKDVKDVYFALTLVVDKQNNLQVYNTKEDGDWKENVDCNTLIVKDVQLRI